MDSRTKALESMSRAQSDHLRRYGEHDPLLQRRIDALMKKASNTTSKKKPATKKVTRKGPAKKKSPLSSLRKKKRTA